MPALDDDAITAVAGLVARTGASEFEFGYLNDGVPIHEAGWWAAARYHGARITVENHQGPDHAADALARRLLTGAQCQHCGRVVSLSNDAPGPSCRWRRMGARWERGCESSDSPRRTAGPSRRDRRRRARKGRG